MTDLRIAVILGSTRPDRNGKAVADWVMDQAADRPETYELVDLADHPLPLFDEPLSPSLGRYQGEHTRKWADVIGRYDGFVFVTPEYNRSTTGVLKNAIDYLYAEWHDKAAAFVGYGALGGSRAIEHLRNMAAELRLDRAPAAELLDDDRLRGVPHVHSGRSPCRHGPDHVRSARELVGRPQEPPRSAPGRLGSHRSEHAGRAPDSRRRSAGRRPEERALRQGAVGQVRRVLREGRVCVEKRMVDPARHGTEALALRALARSGLPVPELITDEPGAVVMSLMPGDRLDEVDADTRLDGMRASAVLLRLLHQLPVPKELPTAPDDAVIVRRYRDAGGPPLPFVTTPRERVAFCHGDWTDGNLLVSDGEITGVLDWEAAHSGDPIRELARAAWGAARKDPRCLDVMVEAYGADPSEVAAWIPVHAAELWLWFAEAGPPAYLAQLTAELRAWPHG